MTSPKRRNIISLVFTCLRISKALLFTYLFIYLFIYVGIDPPTLGKLFEVLQSCCQHYMHKKKVLLLLL